MWMVNKIKNQYLMKSSRAVLLLPFVCQMVLSQQEVSSPQITSIHCLTICTRK
nr:MAG TPA: hypothetical protein [Caudoviricetes sp.]